MHGKEKYRRNEITEVLTEVKRGRKEERKGRDARPVESDRSTRQESSMPSRTIDSTMGDRKNEIALYKRYTKNTTILKRKRATLARSANWH